MNDSTRPPRRRSITPRGLGTFAIIALGLLGAPTTGAAQTLRGRVVDAQSRANVTGAMLELLDSAGARVTSVAADRDGRFSITAPDTGAYRVRITSIGYVTSVLGPVQINRGTAPEVMFGLSPEAIPLDSVRVTASARVPGLERAGYYYRKRDGVGHFIERAAIEARNPRKTTGLLRPIAGVRVLSRHTGSDVLLRAGLGSTIPGGGRGTCYPQIWLNGLLVSSASPFTTGDGYVDRYDIDSLKPGDIEAIEVYSGPAQVPPQFGGAHSACGVILFWTRQQAPAARSHRLEAGREHLVHHGCHDTREQRR